MVLLRLVFDSDLAAIGEGSFSKGRLLLAVEDIESVHILEGWVGDV